MTFGKLKRDIKKLNKIVKQSDGSYSQEDDEFIKDIIRKFREFMKYLSPENRQEFKTYAQNYKAKLKDLINCINGYIPLIQPRYNKAQFKEIRKSKRMGWRKKR